MPPSPSVDRRRHARHPCPAGVRLHHEPSDREFPARCIDAARGGVLMYMPATCPIREGDAIRVQFNHVDREELTQLKDQEISGVVVRVDRKAVVKLARLAVGIRFAEPQ